MLTDTDPAAPQVVLTGEGDNVPHALLDAANNVVALSARRPSRRIESRCMSPEVALMRRPSGLRNGPLIGVKPEVTGRRRELRFWSESYLSCFFWQIGSAPAWWRSTQLLRPSGPTWNRKRVRQRLDCSEDPCRMLPSTTREQLQALLANAASALAFQKDRRPPSHTLPTSANPVRTVQEVIPIAQGALQSLRRVETQSMRDVATGSIAFPTRRLRRRCYGCHGDGFCAEHYESAATAYFDIGELCGS